MLHTAILVAMMVVGHLWGILQWANHSGSQSEHASSEKVDWWVDGEAKRTPPLVGRQACLLAGGQAAGTLADMDLKGGWQAEAAAKPSGWLAERRAA